MLNHFSERDEMFAPLIDAGLPTSLVAPIREAAIGFALTKECPFRTRAIFLRGFAVPRRQQLRGVISPLLYDTWAFAEPNKEGSSHPVVGICSDEILFYRGAPATRHLADQRYVSAMSLVSSRMDVTALRRYTFNPLVLIQSEGYAVFMEEYAAKFVENLVKILG